MGEIAKKIIDIINPKAKIISDLKRFRPKKSEVFRLVGSNEKLKNLTDWIPKYNINEGINETIFWFKKNKNLKQYKFDIYNV